MRGGWPLLLSSALAAGCLVDPFEGLLPLAMRLQPARVSDQPVLWCQADLDVRMVRLRPCVDGDVVFRWPGVPTEVTTFPGPARLPTDADPGARPPNAFSVGFDEPVSLTLRRRPRIPVGPWCGMDLVMGGPLVLEGRWPLVENPDRQPGECQDSGARVSMRIDLPDLTLPLSVEFAEALDALPLVVELGGPGWLGPVGDALSAGEDVAVTPDDPVHGLLVEELVLAAGLYRDLDRDGRLSPGERETPANGGGFLLGLRPVGE